MSKLDSNDKSVLNNYPMNMNVNVERGNTIVQIAQKLGQHFCISDFGIYSNEELDNLLDAIKSYDLHIVDNDGHIGVHCTQISYQCQDQCQEAFQKIEYLWHRLQGRLHKHYVDDICAILHFKKKYPCEWTTDEALIWLVFYMHYLQFTFPTKDEDLSNIDKIELSQAIQQINENKLKEQFSNSEIANQICHYLNLWKDVAAYEKEQHEEKKDRKLHISGADLIHTNKEGNLLWQFIYKMLVSGQHNDKIKWIQSSSWGEFKMLQPHKVAKMWGDTKFNDFMDYEKMSRSLRTYCKNNKVMVKCKQLHTYKFVLTQQEIENALLVSKTNQF